MAGLTLCELKLAHFRSHRAARIVLDGRPVALYGPNGAGKTNILEAISLLSPGRGLRRTSAVEMARRPGALGWKVAGVLAGDGGPHEVETWAEAGAAVRRVRIDGKHATQAALGGVARILWLEPSMDRLWMEGAEGRRRYLDRMTLSFIPSHGEAVLSYDKARRERNRLLRDQVDDMAWFSALEGRMAKAGAEVIANRANALARLAAAQLGAETAFPTAKLALAEPPGAPEIGDEAGLVRALAAGRTRDRAAGRTLSGPHRTDLVAVYGAKGMAARLCSTGEQKALLISLVLANARALAEDLGTPPILLLDEVAAHLDAERRGALYAEIGALGAQAWMTGTDVELFAALGKSVVRLEVRGEGGASMLREVGP